MIYYIRGVHKEDAIIPEVSRFYGIIVKMIFNDTDRHHKPHVHVYYGENEASVALDGKFWKANFR